MDNKDEELIDKADEFYDDDEYKKALDALNSSKASRVADKKKKQKEESKKKVKENEGESFIDKCKKDPVIPICVLALAVIAFFAFFYLTKFIIGCFKSSDLGLTTSELRTQYLTTNVYKSVLVNGNFAIPEIQLTDAVSSDGDSADDNKYFMTVIPNTTGYATIINGSVDKDSQVIKQLKLAVSYEDSISSEIDRFAFIDLFYSSYMQLFINDFSEDQIEILIGDAIKNARTDNYYYVDDIAYKVVSNANESGHMVVIDIIPKSQVDDNLLIEAAIPDSNATFSQYISDILNGN